MKRIARMMTWSLAIWMGGAALGQETSKLELSEKAPVRMLFVGSSSAYWNDLPREVAKVIDGKFSGRLGASVSAEIVGRSGDDIRVYSEPGFNRYEYGVKPGQTFLQKVAEEKFDLVALMVVCRFITREEDGGSAHAEAVMRYCTAIREGGGEPVFYEVGWGTSEDNVEGRKRLLELAVKNGVKWYVPCSHAWERVYRERPDLELQHPKDNVHPGDLGHFLNLACFYATLTGEDPKGVLPRTFPVWPHGLGKPETAEEEEAQQKRIAAFEPDEYQARLPKWMHKNMSMKLTAKLDEETATYLEKVAFEVVQATQSKLKEALKP